MVEKAEQLLLDYGFRQVRVRIHDNLARIEVLPEQFDKLMEEKARADVVAKLPATTFNAVVAIVFAPVLAVSIRKALEHNHLTLE